MQSMPKKMGRLTLTQPVTFFFTIAHPNNTKITQKYIPIYFKSPYLRPVARSGLGQQRALEH